MRTCCVARVAALIACAATAAEEGRRYDLVKRAIEIDPAAKEHPEIGFTFAAAKGKPIDVQHAVVDTRVPSQGRLVIWLCPIARGSSTGSGATGCTASR